MATIKPWIFVQNFALNVTHDSYRLAVRISGRHLRALKSQAGTAFFDELIASYEPLHNVLSSSYAIWVGQGGSQLGETLSVYQLLRLLSNTKVKAWDIAIQGQYVNTSPEYKKLLPSGRQPFQNASQAQVETNLEALANTIGDDAALKAVKADVEAFAKQLKTAFNVQKAAIANTKTNSDNVEAARVEMCIGQYANLGLLMHHFARTPDYIGQYFDLVGIRHGSQVVYTGDTKPGEQENIFKYTFAPGDKLELRNEGPTELHFYLATQKASAANGTQVLVAPGQFVTVTPADLGEATATYLNVYNADAINKGDWTVEFV